jgi:hypothetical protein
VGVETDFPVWVVVVDTYYYYGLFGMAFACGRWRRVRCGWWSFSRLVFFFFFFDM